MTQERISDTDAAKVDVKEKSVAPNPSDASDASNASNINTPKIDVKRGIGKPRAVAISLSQCMYLRQQVFRESQLYGEGADTGKFNAKKESEKEATKTDAE